MKRYSHIALSMLLIVMSVALIGCSGDKNNDNNAGGNNSENNISQKEPTNGGTVVVGIQQDIDSLDPHKAVAAGTSEVLFNVYEGLVKPDKEGNLNGAVASDYKISEDGMTYTFTLRDGIKFHNGNPVTVKDIVYSVKRSAGLLDKEDNSIVVGSALKNISEVKATDDKTVEIKLKSADTELLGYLTFAIIPEGYEKCDTAPIGTGPFKFTSYTAGQNIVIEKNADYWGKQAYLDKVTFKVVEKAETAMMELQAGSIDIYPYITEDQAAQIKSQFDIEVGNMNLVQALFLNNGTKPFDNEKVRQALCYAIDRQAILDMVAGGKGNIIGSGVFSGFTKYFNQDLVSYYNVDTTKAKQLLSEAGYPNGFEFTITVPSNYQYHMDTAEVIVDQLSQIGVTAKIKPIEWASWLSDVYAGRNYEATIIGLDADLAPSDLLARYQSEAKNNFISFNDKEYDDIFAKARVTTNDTEKVDNYKQLQKILTEHAASVYIADPPLMVAVSKKLGGYTFYPVYVQDMSSVYIAK
ncbi:MAG: ABC transporter substrate-binding protein [bacterium]|nr:ABC transporter substrate-binding protein [bacterium]